VPEPLPSVPVPEPEVPEPLVSVPEPEPEVPEPLVSVPEPLVSVPEPLVSVPEPLVSVPDPLLPGAVLSWPLLVVLVLSVGFVAVPVGALPVSWPGLESLEHVSEPFAFVGGVVAVSPELVVWVEPSVGQAVPCVSAEPAAAPSAPLAAPAVEASVVSKLSLEAMRMRLVACVLAALCAAAAWWVVAARWVAPTWWVVAEAAVLAAWEALTVCDGAGATCELKLTLCVRTGATCELKPDAACTTRACVAACASAQCEPPRPSAPVTPKTAAPAALMSATEHNHLLRSMILSRHRVIAVPDSIPVPPAVGPQSIPVGGGYSPG
jgi:hypothetical protein